MNTARLVLKHTRAQNRVFWRTPVAAFFTIILPFVMLLLFIALFGNENVDTPYGNVDLAQFFTPGLAVFAAASATYTNIGINLSIRRDDGILKRVRGTPLPPWIFLLGVVLSAIWIALMATVIMVGTGMLLYGVELEAAKLPALAVSFVVGTGSFAMLGIALAALSRTASSAPAIANATMLPMAFISQVFIPLDSTTPRWLEITGDIFPLKNFVLAFGDAMSPFTEAPAFRPANLAVLGAWAAVGALVAWRKFRWEPLPGASGSRRRRRAAATT